MFQYSTTVWLSFARIIVVLLVIIETFWISVTANVNDFTDRRVSCSIRYFKKSFYVLLLSNYNFPRLQSLCFFYVQKCNLNLESFCSFILLSSVPHFKSNAVLDARIATASVEAWEIEDFINESYEQLAICILSFSSVSRDPFGCRGEPFCHKENFASGNKSLIGKKACGWSRVFFSKATYNVR